MNSYDVLIAGGGIVGLATAYQLVSSRPDLRVAVLEKETAVAQHQSSHNSGVIHSGIYYRPGSLRAANCRRGYTLLLDFCRKNDLPFDICGKIIVAVEETERPRLQAIYERGLANGLEGLRRIPADAVRDLEPHVQALEAVYVPQSGIVDFGAVARCYAALFEAAGGTIRTQARVMNVHVRADAVTVETTDSSASAQVFVNCAGLYADRVAALTGQPADVQILPFRGEFYELLPERQHLVRNLIYPVPNPNFPFLGVHFTRMIGGGIEAGPNAVLAFAREGYSRWQLQWSELAETLAFPGFQRIARRYWRDGLAEMQRSYSKTHFVRALQRLVPEIRSGDVVPGRSGVRAMACDRAGNLLDDFLILEAPRVVNVVNAPSPAATASLAIGETLAARVLRYF